MIQSENYMPKLKLISLFCETTEDSTGPDEAYLTVNGRRVWGPESINDHETRGLDGVGEVEFTTSAQIKLYDEDSGIFGVDNDDDLGTIDAKSDMAGQGEKRERFTRDGANYTLTFEVKA